MFQNSSKTFYARNQHHARNMASPGGAFSAPGNAKDFNAFCVEKERT
jgi:hypothetical protein